MPNSAFAQATTRLQSMLGSSVAPVQILDSPDGALGLSEEKLCLASYDTNSRQNEDLDLGKVSRHWFESGVGSGPGVLHVKMTDGREKTFRIANEEAPAFIERLQSITGIEE